MHHDQMRYLSGIQIDLLYKIQLMQHSIYIEQNIEMIWSSQAHRKAIGQKPTWGAGEMAQQAKGLSRKHDNWASCLPPT